MHHAFLARCCRLKISITPRTTDVDDNLDAGSPSLEPTEVPGDDAAEERRLQDQVAALIGSLHGGDPTRAERASERVRDVIAQKSGR